MIRARSRVGTKVSDWLNPPIVKTTLDLMEYASDALAQAAYVTSATYGSDILTGGTASADTEYSGSCPAANACDGDTGTEWVSAVAAFPHWWTYDLGAGVTKIVQKLRIYPHHDGDGADIKDFELRGSNNGSDWATVYTGQVANGAGWQDFTFSNTVAYRYYRVYATSTWDLTTVVCRIGEFEMMELSLQSYSESTIKTQGSYSLKGVATTDALNKTLTRTISSSIDLTGVDTLRFDIRSTRTGSNIKIGIHDSGGTTTEVTPNITDANTWQLVVWDISAVANANKDAIDSIIVTIANADSANTFYMDNMWGMSMHPSSTEIFVSGSDPIGSLLMWPTGTPPSGYLECDGSSLLRATYADLFAVIGDDFGAVDGDHFTLPDMRGRFLRGWAHGQTTDPDKATRTDRGDGTTGDYVGTLQGHDLKAHTHTAMANASSAGSTGASSPAQNATTDSGSYGGNETRPINMNVMVCVRYQ